MKSDIYFKTIYAPKLLLFSLFFVFCSVILDQFVIAFSIEKVLCVHFSWYIFLLNLKPYGMLTWEKLKFESVFSLI